jgi:hypothetical protein
MSACVSIAMSNPEIAYRQRIQLIVTSYNLAGYDAQAFETYLNALMGQVPLLLLELALVETLMRQWLRVPVERGVQFLAQTQSLLGHWQSGKFDGCLTPLHFEMITGLDPAPTFGGLDQVLQDWCSAADRVLATVQIPATDTP